MVFYLGKYVYNWSTAANTCKIWKVRTTGACESSNWGPPSRGQKQGHNIDYPDLYNYPDICNLPGFAELPGFM